MKASLRLSLRMKGRPEKPDGGYSWENMTKLLFGSWTDLLTLQSGLSRDIPKKPRNLWNQSRTVWTTTSPTTAPANGLRLSRGRSLPSGIGVGGMTLTLRESSGNFVRRTRLEEEPFTVDVTEH